MLKFLSVFITYHFFILHFFARYLPKNSKKKSRMDSLETFPHPHSFSRIVLKWDFLYTFCLFKGRNTKNWDSKNLWDKLYKSFLKCFPSCLFALKKIQYPFFLIKVFYFSFQWGNGKAEELIYVNQWILIKESKIFTSKVVLMNLFCYFELHQTHNRIEKYFWILIWERKILPEVEIKR